MEEEVACGLLHLISGALVGLLPCVFMGPCKARKRYRVVIAIATCVHTYRFIGWYKCPRRELDNSTLERSADYLDATWALSTVPMNLPLQYGRFYLLSRGILRTAGNNASFSDAIGGWIVAARPGAMDGYNREHDCVRQDGSSHHCGVGGKVVWYLALGRRWQLRRLVWSEWNRVWPGLGCGMQWRAGSRSRPVRSI